MGFRSINVGNMNYTGMNHAEKKKGNDLKSILNADADDCIFLPAYTPTGTQIAS